MVLDFSEHLTASHQIVGNTDAVSHTALDLRHFGVACTKSNMPIDSKYRAVRGKIHLPLG